jgi:AcrR family transcriptional regulator
MARKRKYELKARAETQEETRRRIIAATVALHQEVGPAKTTISEVAKRAGVQRLTVYNNFPDEASLLGACSAHWVAQHPPPDPGAWQSIRDPVRRARAALTALYGYYRQTERMSANVLRDAETMPALRTILEQGRGAFISAVRDDLAAAWERRGPPNPGLRAALSVVLQFETWRALARGEGMNDDQAAEIAIAMARGARASGR